MKKQTLWSNIQKLDINYIKLSIIILSILAFFNILQYLFLSGDTNKGRLEILSLENTSPIIHLPIFPAESTLEGKQSILDSRNSQLDQANSTGSLQILADGSLFTETAEDLPWFNPEEEKIPGRSLYKQNLAFGLLNPMMLVSPLIVFTDTQNLPTTNITEVVDFRNLFFNPARTEGTVQIILSQDFANNNKKLLTQTLISTLSFNAFDLGFNFIQPDIDKSSNLAISPISENPSQIFSHFYVSSCAPTESDKEESLKCNQFLPAMGNHAIQIKDLPASASFKLWKQQPEADTPPDMTFKINFELGD